MAARIGDGGANLIAAEYAERAVDGRDHQARQRGGTAGFVQERVTGLVHDDGVALACPDAIRDLVAHGAGRQKHRGFLAEKFGDPFLQQVGGWILECLLVAALGLGHGLAHAGRRLGIGVGVQIDAKIAGDFCGFAGVTEEVGLHILLPVPDPVSACPAEPLS
jgi:hypothetical protein